MKQFITDDIKLLYPLYYYSENIKYDIHKELYRGELYCNLLKVFSKSCLTNLNEKIFSHKKSSYRTITNLLSSWFFTLYQYYNFSDDPFYPTNFNYMDTLIKTIEDYWSIHNVENTKEKIDKIISDLIFCYEDILKKLTNYKTNETTAIVSKKKIIQERDNVDVLFYKFNLDIKSYHHVNCNKLNNIINNIIIPIEQYNIIEHRYNNIMIGKTDEMDSIIWIVLYRYQLLSSNNNQLAVLENILEKMKIDFNLSHECFASAINGTLSSYCSIYYDVERYFGSIGSYFNVILQKGTFSFNPPYQYDIINNGIKRMIEFLDNTSDELNFIITIPIWDLEGKKIMADNLMENNNTLIKYNDFNTINMIKNSKYFKGLRMISKDEFTYFDHNFHLYKNKTIQNTYVIVMSNNIDCNYINMINDYDFFTFT